MGFTLHDWQVLLCGILERLVNEKGLRLLIHGPPQYGKSVITSQRLLAWLLGHRPNLRTGLACYNLTHATGFGEVILRLMQSQDFKEVFPEFAVRVPTVASARAFWTEARTSMMDAQASFTALGLLSGFTGKGLDCLVVDDPYASADQAYSLAINERVWRWWEQTAGVRVSDEANVVVMFHRYHLDDFAGRLLDTGKFEYIRFPCEADENEDGSDPTGRTAGELLSPMRSREWVDDQKAKEPWMGQFQGRPGAVEGTHIKRQWFTRIPKGTAPRFTSYVRAWDVAMTDDGGDWTVGILGGIDEQGNLYVLNVERQQTNTPQVRETILHCHRFDPPGTLIAIERSTASLSLIQDLNIWKDEEDPSHRLPIVEWTPVVHPLKKLGRAAGWIAAAKSGRLKLINDAWTDPMLTEFAFFKNQPTDVDDQVDAMTILFDTIFARREPAGVVNDLRGVGRFERAMERRRRILRNLDV